MIEKNYQSSMLSHDRWCNWLSACPNRQMPIVSFRSWSRTNVKSTVGRRRGDEGRDTKMRLTYLCSRSERDTHHLWWCTNRICASRHMNAHTNQLIAMSSLFAKHPTIICIDERVTNNRRTTNMTAVAHRVRAHTINASTNIICRL